MNFLTDQQSIEVLISASSSSSLPNNIGMYYSIHRSSDNFESYHGHNDKDDRITPLTDKLYYGEIEERSCLTPSGSSMDLKYFNRNLHRQEFVDDARRWSLGKISVLILMVLSFADIIIYMVDAQIDSLESHDHYDALSADVIRPAFRYHGDRPKSSRTKPLHSMGLGSAAISSITTTLSGIDLRREDYWTDGFFGSFYDVVEKVREVFEESPITLFSISNPDENDYDSPSSDVLNIPRGGASVAARGRTKRKPKTKKKPRTPKHEHVLSNSDCFVPLKEIADSTLKDVTMSFRYILESTTKDFNRGKFMSGLLPRVKKLMERITVATNEARGNGVASPITAERNGLSLTGDIDAINFCAAMRIFAEWRPLRQVPPGYKGYAVGIGLGQKDIVQNIAKIEDAIHDYIDLQYENDDENTSFRNSRVVTSPTLRDLLQYEVDTNIHDNAKLPRLKEKSAAMGLLWVRRQLVYQTAIFNNVLDVPSRFASSRAAVQAAYDDVYGDLHGWTIQKIFSYSFQAAPEGIEIYKFMNPHRLKEVQQEAEAKILGKIVKNKRKFRGPLNLGKLENTPIGRFSRHIGNEWNKIACNVVNEWDKLSDNVGNEWDKMAGNIGQLFGQQRHKHDDQINGKEQPSRPRNDCVSLTAELDPAIVADEAAKEFEMEKYISQDMRTDAYEHIKAYLEVVDPLLDDLTALIDEFNMDDPTKV